MRDDKAFAACFANSSNGHALYRNESANDIRPGSCGYFDWDGKWVTIVQTILLEPSSSGNSTDKTVDDEILAAQTATSAPEPEPEPEDGSTPNSTDAPAAGNTEIEVQVRIAKSGEDNSAASGSDQTAATPAPGGSSKLETLIGETEALDITQEIGLDAAQNLIGAVKSAAAKPETKEAKPDTGENTSGSGISFTSLEGARITAKRDQEAWGVIQAGNISLREYNLKLDAALIPKTPIHFKSWVGFENRTRRGAVLATDGLVSYHDAQPIDVLEDWVEANLASIMKTPHARTVKEKGLWIVTKTFTSKKRAVAVMQSSGQSVALGVDASIPNIFEVGPSMKWWQTAVDKPGWKAQVDDDGIVLFMSGLYWKPWPIIKSMHVKREKERQTVLGAADGIDVVVKGGGWPGGEDEEYYTFKPNMVGRVEGQAVNGIPKINYFDEMESEDEDDDDD